MSKRILMLLAATLAFCGLQSNAQNVMGKGSSIVSAGLGVSSSTLPLYASYDYGVIDNLFNSPNAALSVGAMGGMVFADNSMGYLVGPRVAIHYHFIPELDSYFSLMLGADGSHFRTKELNISSWKHHFGWGAHLGTRYFFNPNVGAFVEIGYGYSYANVGITFKL